MLGLELISIDKRGPREENKFNSKEISADNVKLYKLVRSH